MTGDHIPALGDQPAPYDQEAEEATLGAVLINPTALPVVAEHIKRSDDWFLQRHAFIWRALTRLHERNEPIDFLTVSSELKRVKLKNGQTLLENIGGQSYLTYLINNTPTSIYAETYAALVAKAGLRRRLLQAVDEIRSNALDEMLSTDQIVEMAYAILMRETHDHDPQSSHQFIDLINEWWNNWEKYEDQGGLMGFPTGFHDLDELLTGLHKGDLITFAGPTGMGKTAWLINLALNVGRAGGRVKVFTMEMGADQLTQRALSVESVINAQKIRTMNIQKMNERSRLIEAMGRLGKFAIDIDDSPRLTPGSLLTKSQRMQYSIGLDLVILDYMQLMTTGDPKLDKMPATQMLAYISRNVKEAARTLNVPIVAAAQMNRAIFNRADKMPTLADLRQSGTIEQDSDVVIFLHHYAYWDENTDFPNQADLIVAKHRNGPTGTVNLYYDRRTTRFANAETRHIDLNEGLPIKDAKRNEMSLGRRRGD